MNTYTALEKNILRLLKQKKFVDVLRLLRKTDNEKIVMDKIWDIIRVICSTVKEKSLLKNEDDVARCQKILLSLVEKGNPKEVLIALLEQADTFKDNEFFIVLLEPLQVVLKKTPGKRGKSLQWVLSALNAHIESMEKPKDLDLQNEQKLLLDLDPAVQDTAYVLKSYLKFLKYFVNEVSFENLKGKDIPYFDRLSYQQEILQKYILKLFYLPFLYHDLTVCDGKPKSTIQVVCEDYISCLSKICHNVFNLFQFDSSNAKNAKSFKMCEAVDDDSVSILAFSNLAYLIFVENMTVHFQPLVYSHYYSFLNNIKYILPLLKQTENLVLHKGLQLSKVLLGGINDFEFKFECLGQEGFLQFSKVLFDVAIFSQVESHRQSAIESFKTFASKCEPKVQYYIVMKTFSAINHSGAQGILIDLYKNNLHNELMHSNSDHIFSGKPLKKFVEKALVLEHGVETDIVENSDRIVASLNFLKYILMRDKKETNVTGIWDLCAFVSDHLVSPLTMALDFSRAHYEEAHKDVSINKKAKGSLNSTVTVNKVVLPNIPPNFQKQIYNAALTTFDFVEYLLANVKELM